MKEAEERKKMREEDERRGLKEKQKRDIEREQHRKNVQGKMSKIEEERREGILHKLGETDEMVKRTQEAAEKERKEKSLSTAIKRRDREENVKRIEKINEYQRGKTMEKILMDNERAEKIRMEKESLLMARQNLRKQIDSQKEEMLEVFEKVKKKGKLDAEDLKKLKLQETSPKDSKNIENKKKASSPSGKKAKKKKRRSLRKSIDYPDKQLIIQNYSKEQQTRSYHRSDLNNEHENNISKKDKVDTKEATRRVNELRTRLHNDLIKEIEKEQQKENERDELLRNVKYLLSS